MRRSLRCLLREKPLPSLIHLKHCRPVTISQPFHPGDLAHFKADFSKAQRLLA
jgi:hypothetical protein